MPSLCFVSQKQHGTFRRNFPMLCPIPSPEVIALIRCDACDIEMIDVQTKMNFHSLSGEQDWGEFPVLANVVQNVGRSTYTLPFRPSLRNGWLRRVVRPTACFLERGPRKKLRVSD